MDSSKKRTAIISGTPSSRFSLGENKVHSFVSQTSRSNVNRSLQQSSSNQQNLCDAECIGALTAAPIPPPPPPPPPTWPEEEVEEDNTILLDAKVITGEQAQALAAIMARACPNVHITLDTLLEAVSVFPTVVPVIECLLDQRIIGLVQSCQAPSMLSTVVRLIETSAIGETNAPTQACSFLQQCGFAGLWRYAGSFLSPRASLQAINANLCSALECILTIVASKSSSKQSN